MMNEIKENINNFKQLNSKFLFLGLTTIFFVIFLVLKFEVLNFILQAKSVIVLFVFGSLVFWSLSYQKIKQLQKEELSSLHALRFGVANTFAALSIIVVYMITAH